ncbi:MULTISPECIES: tryptophan ABC transporter substrate-binding protein [unclassified Jeotgalibaca]|uniref:tryptophan ABC transporter substrate-binding protein n=1 Tax=unclassified Jeotgalibaca TaxID=2621505 RepID=UPI003FD198A6
MKFNKTNTKFAFLASAALLLGACGSDSEETSSSQVTDASNLPYIGIMQLASHPALDAITEGIIDQLADEGYVDGETATIDLQNAQGDQSNMQQIAERFISNEADITVGIATPAAQALANATTDIPIILGAITDPLAANLVSSLEEPGGNITGVSDKIPVTEQFELIMKLVPELQTIGFLYSSSEDNSLSSAKEAEEVANALGLTVVTKTVNSSNDIPQVSEALAQEVDAIWIPTDNVIATSMLALIEVTDAYQIPVFPSVDTMVQEGGIATVGLNQYAIGIQTGAVTAEVLEGADPSSFAIQYPDEIELIINTEKAEELNIEVPADILETAIIIE